MKRIINWSIFILLMLILLGKMSNWVFNYSKEVNEILTTIMFCAIGISYLFGAFAYSNRWYRVVFALCGIYLISMNFVERTIVLTIIGITCLVTPMILARFDKSDPEEVIE